MTTRLASVFDGEQNLSAIIFMSLIFHVVLIIIFPLLWELIRQKPKTFTRPPTFELISVQVPVTAMPRPIPKEIIAPTPKAPVIPVENPTIVKEKPKAIPKEKVKKAPAKSVPQKKKEVKEDLSDLEMLFSSSTPTPVTLHISEIFPYQWYLDNIQTRIKSNWKPTSSDRNSVVVRFTIKKNGQIAGLTVSQSSGNHILDRQAVRAVEVSVPFPTLPSRFSGEELRVDLTLKPFK